jgi:hypothetical protein
MFIVGIDPGKSGCLWGMDANTRKTVAFHDIECLGADIDVIAIKQFLDQFPVDNTIVVMEDPHPHGTSGDGCKTVYAAFQYGKSVGTIIGIITGMGYRFIKVSPPTWKSHFALTAGNATYLEKKKMSVEKACYLSGEDSIHFNYMRFDKRVVKHDRAEAFLIAIYGLEKCLI